MSEFKGSLLVIILLVTIGIESFDFVPLYGYVHQNYHTHFYTYNASFIGYAVPGRIGAYGYRSEGIVCLLSEGSGCNREVPLYHYGNKFEMLYTTNSSEADRNYQFLGIVGYCYRKQKLHTVPLYRYRKNVRSTVGGVVNTDHYYTTDANKIRPITPCTSGKNEYTYEGVACFVYNVKYH